MIKIFECNCLRLVILLKFPGNNQLEGEGNLIQGEITEFKADMLGELYQLPGAVIFGEPSLADLAQYVNEIVLMRLVAIGAFGGFLNFRLCARGECALPPRLGLPVVFHLFLIYRFLILTNSGRLDIHWYIFA